MSLSMSTDRSSATAIYQNVVRDDREAEHGSGVQLVDSLQEAK